jgi:hypothetical protein
MIADRQTSDVTSNFTDFSGTLVAKNYRGFGRMTTFENGEIGAAHATSVHFNDHFVRGCGSGGVYLNNANAFLSTLEERPEQSQHQKAI